MASTAKFPLDEEELINKAEIDKSSEVSRAIVNRNFLNPELSEQNKLIKAVFNENNNISLNNFINKDNLNIINGGNNKNTKNKNNNNKNNHANSTTINTSVTISNISVTSNGQEEEQEQKQQHQTNISHHSQTIHKTSSEENQNFSTNNNIPNFINNNYNSKSDINSTATTTTVLVSNNTLGSGTFSVISATTDRIAGQQRQQYHYNHNHNHLNRIQIGIQQEQKQQQQQQQQKQQQQKSLEQYKENKVQQFLPQQKCKQFEQNPQQKYPENYNYLQQGQNMPKSNEPIKLVYPIATNVIQQQQQQQQQSHQQHQQQQIHHSQQQHLITSTQHNSTFVTMNSNNQATGNRVTFTGQSLPNGTINITTQPQQQQQQQIMHAVSSGGLPNSTTIKTTVVGQQQSQNPGGAGPGGGGGPPPGTTQLGNQQNIVGTPTMLPAGVVVGVRPGTPTQNQQKNVSAPIPRVVIGGHHHMVGTRPASPAITLSALQAAGQSGPTLILKTENGYQLLRVGPPQAAPVASQNITNSAGNQTIRLQTVPAASIAATSSTSLVVNSVASTNATQVLGTQVNASIQQHQPSVASVTAVPSMTVSAQQSQQHAIQQQQQSHQQQTQQQIQHQLVQPQQQQQLQQQQQQQSQQQQQQQQNTTVSNSSGSTQTIQNASAAQKKNTLQGNTKEKCRKFLANLLELSSREPAPVKRNVRTLIQELIDAHVEPEEFCTRLERLLNASPQPCLIGFLKKSLPLLRQSLFTKELVIEGIRPPPEQIMGHLIGSTTLTSQLPKIQAQIRPIGQQTTTIGQTQVRMVSQSSVGPRPIGQTTITKQTSGGVRIQGPIQTSIGGLTQAGNRIGNAQIRPVSSASTLVQSPPALQPVSGSQTVFATPQQNVVQIRATTPANRSSGIQIRTATPVVRAIAPAVKNATGASGGITQVKVGQIQIKPIPSQVPSSITNSTSNNTSSNSTISIPSSNIISSNSSSSIPVNSISVAPSVTSTTASSSNVSATTIATTSASTNKIITVKTQSSQSQSNKKSSQEKKDKTATLASAASTAFFQQAALSVSSSMYGDDDINDVAAMGGVNLAEETQKILGSTELIGTQIRSCKDEIFLHLPALQNKIRTIVAEKGLEEPSQEVAILISHACQERLKNIVEKLAVIAEHRIDIIKVDPRYEITRDVRGQIKFLEELDKAEQKRHEEQEREMLLRAAKSRSKIEDPEQAKLKAKAKEMQRAEMEELRQRDANMTALQAIGPRKKPKLDGDVTTLSSNSGISGTGAPGISPTPLRPRIKRVNLRDMLFFLEQERETCRSTMLYKTYLK